jgi:hypothetical protein
MSCGHNDLRMNERAATEKDVEWRLVPLWLLSDNCSHPWEFPELSFPVQSSCDSKSNPTNVTLPTSLVTEGGWLWNHSRLIWFNLLQANT